MDSAEKHEEKRPGGCSLSAELPRSETFPKKGILKHSFSDQQLRKHDAVANAAPEIVIEKPCSSLAVPEQYSSYVVKSKIPKLCVTWVENGTPTIGVESQDGTKLGNLQPMISEFKNNDDGAENSKDGPIVGSWWNGRDTRYVVHCSKHHDHTVHDEDYTTPTQRKNQEIILLKNQLKQTEAVLKDRESHLQQLRERLSELESILDRGGLLTENHRLMTKVSKIHEKCRNEKKLICDRYEAEIKRLRMLYEKDNEELEEQMNFELDEIRTKFVDSSIEKKCSISDTWDSSIYSGGTCETQKTTVATCTSEDSTPEGTVDELQACQNANNLLKMRVSELEFALRQFEGNVNNGDGCGNGQCASKLWFMSAQVEAYKNECIIWRTRASELEIGLKDLLITNGSLEQQVTLLEQEKSSLQTSASKMVEEHRLAVTESQDFEEIEAEPGLSESSCEDRQRHALSLAGNSQLVSCPLNAVTESTLTELSNENQNLRKEVAQLNNDLMTSEKNREQLRNELVQKSEELSSSQQLLHDVEQRLYDKCNEVEKVELDVVKLKERNLSLQQSLQKSKDKLEEMENIMHECGIHTFSSINKNKSNYKSSETVYRDRDVQTELSFSEEVHMEQQLKVINDEYDDLQKKYDNETKELETNLAQMSESLSLKNSLVNNLTIQIQTFCEEFESMRQGFERERCSYVSKIEQLQNLTMQIPVLQQNLEMARNELIESEEKFNEERQSFQNTMESSLSESLRLQTETCNYWRLKLAEVEKKSECQKRKLDETNKKLNDTSVKFNIENSKLAQQVSSSLVEITELRNKLNVARTEKAISAVPEMVSCEVLCVPKMNAAGTATDQAELPDEKDHRIIQLASRLDGSLTDCDRLREETRFLLAKLQATEDTCSQAQSKINDLRQQIAVDAAQSEKDELLRAGNEQQQALLKDLELCKAKQSRQPAVDRAVQVRSFLVLLNKEVQTEANISNLKPSEVFRIYSPFALVNDMSRTVEQAGDIVACAQDEHVYVSAAHDSFNLVAEHLNVLDWLKEVLPDKQSEIEALASLHKPEAKSAANPEGPCMIERDQLRNQYLELLSFYQEISAELALYKAEDRRKAEEGREMIVRHISDLDLTVKEEKENAVLKQMLNETCKQLIATKRKSEQLEKEKNRVTYELDILKGEHALLQVRGCQQYDEAMKKDKKHFVNQFQQTDAMCIKELKESSAMKELNEFLRNIDRAADDVLHIELDISNLNEEAVSWKKSKMQALALTKEFQEVLKFTRTCLSRFTTIAEKLALKHEVEISALKQQLEMAEYNFALLSSEIERYNDKLNWLKKVGHSSEFKYLGSTAGLRNNDMSKRNSNDTNSSTINSSRTGNRFTGSYSGYPTLNTANSSSNSDDNAVILQQWKQFRLERFLEKLKKKDSNYAAELKQILDLDKYAALQRVSENRPDRNSGNAEVDNHQTSLLEDDESTNEGSSTSYYSLSTGTSETNTLHSEENVCGDRSGTATQTSRCDQLLMYPERLVLLVDDQRGDSPVCGTYELKTEVSEDELALRFLRESVYYYLTDKESRNQLLAIMNILKFSDDQRLEIMKSKRFH
ncbi:unnamed protein product [Soboliphyme baturini]|uniref:GRIP domain-containing protein n=1 Tax=Soboliphyme baturini TaxID=241478 RepID=A0A183IRJ8_9BILA|nr:unnamed protein product [Soboliphyme baturini]